MDSGLPVPRRAVVRRDSGLWGLERSLQTRGFSHVAGVDEAGRGACAGPLVVASVTFPRFRGGIPKQLADLTDSKLLSPGARERISKAIRRYAVSLSVVVVEAPDVDRRGVHAADLEAMRRAVAVLEPCPGYVLTDGFPVPGLPAPSLSLWKGDRVASCIAAASVLAKHTRDEIMVRLDTRWPGYGFAVHKGYGTVAHRDAMAELGVCPAHRRSFVNVRCTMRGEGAS